MNDSHSDMSPVNNSDSDVFGYFLQTIKWSPVVKSAQYISNENSNGIISWDTSDGSYGKSTVNSIYSDQTVY